jgi:hypothetical protein
MKKVWIGVLVAVGILFVVGGLTRAGDTEPTAVAGPPGKPGITASPSSSPSTSSLASPSVEPVVEVVVGDVAGLSKATAMKAIRDSGLNVLILREESGKSPGTVLRQDPAPGEMVEEGTTMRLYVAEPFPALVSVVGKKVEAATSLLDEFDVTINVVREESSRPVGTVIEQSPSPGTRMKPGSVVTLILAKAAPAPPPATTNCTEGYSPCLPPASDYDCYGGSGNGPAYTDPGVVYDVTGSDPYDLDSDSDGYGCE